MELRYYQHNTNGVQTIPWRKEENTFILVTLISENFARVMQCHRVITEDNDGN
jgi:hypothetical protein